MNRFVLLQRFCLYNITCLMISRQYTYWIFWKNQNNMQYEQKVMMANGANSTSRFK